MARWASLWLMVVLLAPLRAAAQVSAPSVPPVYPPASAAPSVPMPPVVAPSRPVPSSPGNTVPAELLPGYRHLQEGSLRDALAFFERAEKESADADVRMLAREGRADTLDRMGRYDEALAIYQEFWKAVTLPVIGSRSGSRPMWRALEAWTVGNRLGILYFQMGRAAEALAVLQKSEGYARNARDVEMIGRILNNRGLVLADAGRHADAEKAYRAALDLHRKQKDARSVVIALNNLALLELARKRPAAALRLVQAARAAQPSITDVLLRTEFMETEAQVLLAMGKPQQALARFEAAAASAASIDDVETLWAARAGIGRCMRAMGRRAEAITAFQLAVDAIRLLQAGVAPGGQAALLANKQSVFRDLVDLLLRDGRPREALAVEEMARASEMATRFFAAGSRLGGASQERLDTARDMLASSQGLSRRLAEEKDEVRAASLRADIRRTREAFADLAESLDKDQDPALAGLIEINPPDLSKLQTVLPSGAAVLEPIPLEDRLVLLLVTSSGLSATQVNVRADELRAEVSAFRRLLQSPKRDPDGSRLRVHARRLHDWLIAPVQGELQAADVRWLLVSPGGPLRYVPFAALHDGQSYLMERMAVGNLTRAGQLALARAAGPAQSSEMVAVADPDGSLPAARAEVQSITSMMPGQSLVGKDATREAFVDAVEGAEFIHLATHGVLDTANPRSSYLQLAGSGEGARLTYGQIPGLPLLGTELVTLSACSTALGAKTDGGGIYGLAYQFEKAGAASVVATLWQVADESTASLMKSMYEALSKGKSRIEALQEAQLSLARSKRWSHPYYWAPFLLIGDAR